MHSYFNNLPNPYTIAIKQYLKEILKEKYVNYNELIERIAPSLITESDFKSFSKLIIELYESGFVAAIEQHKEGLQKIGLKVQVVNPNKEVNKIFNDE